MPRKKKHAADTAATENDVAMNSGAPTALAETDAPAGAGVEPTAVAEPVERPAWIDGPPTGDSDGPDNLQAKNWGDPYKSIFSTPSFELGENRRFKQRVFIFKEKPEPEVLAKLKDNGFTYRAAEKAWTINANPDTRKLSDELARDLAGPDYIRTVER